MPSLKALGDRIVSVEAIRKIIKALRPIIWCAVASAVAIGPAEARIISICRDLPKATDQDIGMSLIFWFGWVRGYEEAGRFSCVVEKSKSLNRVLSTSAGTCALQEFAKRFAAIPSEEQEKMIRLECEKVPNATVESVLVQLIMKVI